VCVFDVTLYNFKQKKDLVTGGGCLLLMDAQYKARCIGSSQASNRHASLSKKKAGNTRVRGLRTPFGDAHSSMHPIHLVPIEFSRP
jgi:hypothetical protein